MKVKLKSGRTVVVPDEVEDTNQGVLPSGISMLEQVEQIREVLAEGLTHSAHVRSVLFGEGEADEKLSAPGPVNMGGILHDILAQACRLRGELERTGDYLQPQPKQPKGQQVPHA